MRLARVEQEQQDTYPALRALWRWVAQRGAEPYRATPGGAIPQPVATALVENAEAAGRLMGDNGLYSQIVINQLMPSGVAR